MPLDDTAEQRTVSDDRIRQHSDELVAVLIDLGVTIAVAESLTGGAVCAALTGVAGASACFRGGIVSYATDLKATLVGVDPALLRAHGPVDPRVAWQMARGVATRCEATIGASTTGVAGPSSQGGVPVGTVFISVHDNRDGTDHGRALCLAGSRWAIRTQTVLEVLNLATWVATRDVGASVSGGFGNEPPPAQR
ncbi:MAG: nicotinamide-nucleotide amidohydrolase family protein [Actinomycetes bacterium]